MLTEVPAAYIGICVDTNLNDPKLYVTDAEILDRLQLGKFAFIPRSNGNLSFRYLGGQ